MSDWDFLHEMHDRGYSAEDIALAAGAGYAPFEEAYLSREWIEAELRDQPREAADALQSREQFRSREGFPYSVLEQSEPTGSSPRPASAPTWAPRSSSTSSAASPACSPTWR